MVYPLRWSWLHWWEANRDPYLLVLRQGSPNQNVALQVVAAPPADPQLDRVLAALREAARSDQWRIRGAAALALGQMRDNDARQTLTSLAAKDPHERPPQSASVALGLLQTQEAEQSLLGADLKRPEDVISRLMGLGLLSSRTANTLQTIQQNIARGAPPVSWAGMWALSEDRNPVHAPLIRQILARTDNPWIASEAMLALGKLRDQASIPLLTRILLGGEAANVLPAWNALERLRQLRIQLARGEDREPTSDEEYQKAYEQYRADHADWVKTNKNLIRGNKGSWEPAPPERADRVPPETQVFTAGREEVYQGYLRAAAAIALGNMNDPAARQALVQALAQRGDEWSGLQADVWALARLHEFSELHKGMALMSLGQMGDETTLPALIDTLHGRIPTRPDYPPERMADSPLRGYAALALGLYARPVNTPQGVVDRPNVASVCKLLAERVANPAETLEVRTAAALALGLTQRTENLRYLQSIGDVPKRADAVLRGYLLLARALLGDRNIIKPAEKFLKEPERGETMSGVLGRRAAVLALGLLGAEEVIPILIFAWDQSYYVNREVALALSLCQAYSVTDALLDLLTGSEHMLARVFGAKCLGELYVRGRPQPLARLLNGSNYAMRNDAVVPYRALANEFLFYGLIPAFGQIWP